jgi:hypothetical protein
VLRESLEGGHYSSLHVDVELRAPADITDRALVGMDRKTGDGRTTLGMDSPCQAVLNRQGRERRPTRGVFRELHTERGDDSRRAGVFDAAGEAFNLLHDEAELLAELGPRSFPIARVQNRHQQYDQSRLPPQRCWRQRYRGGGRWRR